MSIALTNNFKAVQRKDPKSVAVHILLDFVYLYSSYGRVPSKTGFCDVIIVETSKY